MNFSHKELALSRVELAQMRKDFWQGWIGIVLVLLIGIGFTFMFYSNVPSTNIFQLLFALSPIIGCSLISLYISNSLIKHWRDIKYGYKQLEVGKITQKFMKSTPRSTKSQFKSSSENIRYFIVVNKKRYLIKLYDYNRCKIGQTARMYITLHSLQVMDIEFVSN